MDRYKRKPKQVTAMRYTGELAPAKKFLGIKDAEYDSQTRALVIPGGQEVVPVGNYIVHEDDVFYTVSPEEFDEEFEPAE